MEVAQIYCEYFEKKLEIIREKEKKLKYSSFSDINPYGEKSVFHYRKLLSYLESELSKATEKNLQDYTTIITIKLHVSRILSKLIYKDYKKRVDSLHKALIIYEEVYKSLQSQNSEYKENLNEQLNICLEMIHLLPVKITKVNNGEEIF